MFFWKLFWGWRDHLRPHDWDHLRPRDHLRPFCLKGNTYAHGHLQRCGGCGRGGGGIACTAQAAAPCLRPVWGEGGEVIACTAQGAGLCCAALR